MHGVVVVDAKGIVEELPNIERGGHVKGLLAYG